MGTVALQTNNTINFILSIRVAEVNEREKVGSLPYTIYIHLYFTASIVGKQDHLARYQKIVSELKKHTTHVTYEHILKTSETDLREETESDRRAFYEQLKLWVTQSNAVIAEVSYPSTSVGFEISYAISHHKPVLLLYEKSSRPPSLFEEYSDEQLICQAYEERDLPALINDFLKYVKDTHMTRFTLSLPPRLVAHLEKISRQKNIPKSIYIRGLIERDLNR